MNIITSMWKKRFSKFILKTKRKIKKAVFKITARDGTVIFKEDGISMYVHAVSDSYFLPYEPCSTKIFKSVIKPGSVLIDIGANCGYYSLIGAKQCGKECRIYAFEPDPRNFKLLDRNIRLNSFEGTIKPVQKALGKERGEAKFFLHKNPLLSGIYKNPSGYIKEEVLIECITLDEFLKEEGIESVDIVKIDVEGNELYVLEGMKNTLSKNSSIILFVEFNPLLLKKAGVNPEDFLIQLESLGLDTKLIDEESCDLIPFTKDTYLSLLPKLPRVWAPNLYCTKKI